MRNLVREVYWAFTNRCYKHGVLLSYKGWYDDKYCAVCQEVEMQKRIENMNKDDCPCKECASQEVEPEGDDLHLEHVKVDFMDYDNAD